MSISHFYCALCKKDVAARDISMYSKEMLGTGYDNDLYCGWCFPPNLYEVKHEPTKYPAYYILPQPVKDYLMAKWWNKKKHEEMMTLPPPVEMADIDKALAKATSEPSELTIKRKVVPMEEALATPIDLLSYKEAAKQFGINKNTLGGWVFQGRLKTYKPEGKGHPMVSAAEVETFLATKKPRKTGPKTGSKHSRKVKVALDAVMKGDLIRPEPFAKKHNVPVGTVHSWMSNGKVQRQKVEGVTCFSEGEALAWMENSRYVRGKIGAKAHAKLPDVKKAVPQLPHSKVPAQSTVRTKLKQLMRKNPRLTYTRIANGAGIGLNTVSRFHKGGAIRYEKLCALWAWMERQDGKVKPTLKLTKVQPKVQTKAEPKSNGHVDLDPAFIGDYITGLVEENRKLKEQLAKVTAVLEGAYL